MSDRNFILAPSEQITITLQVEPVLAMLDSLSMIINADDFPGLDPWIYETAKKLTPDQLRRIQLVTWGVLPNYGCTNRGWHHWDVMLDHLRNIDPVEFRDQIVQHIASWERTTPDPKKIDIILGDVGGFIQLIHQHEREKHEKYGKDMPFSDVNYLSDWHELLNHPEQMIDMMVSLLEELWASHLHSEWKRAKRMIEETVDAFSSLDYTNVNGLEAARIITGRDLSNSWFDEQLRKCDEAVFVPVAHLGPYVSGDKGTVRTGNPNTVYIFFRARLPEGDHPKSPELDRSELLVRLNALADDTRLRILELFTLYDELCAPQVIEMLELSQSAASRHLRQLTATGYLMERRREGAKCYSLNSKRVDDTMQALQSFLQK